MASFGANKGFGTGGFGSSTFGNASTAPSWNQPQNQLAITATSAIAPNADWFGDGSGSSLVDYRSTVGKDTSSHTSIYYQSLVFQPEYKKFSAEELRLQDYMDSRLFGENPNANRPKPNSGTRNVPFVETKEKDLVANIIISYQSIMMMPQYRGNSQEELRMEDYRQGTVFQGDSNSLVGSKTNTFGSFGSNTTSTFGSTGFGAATNTSVLGNSSGFGSKPTTFGTNTATSGFGATTSQGTTGFGQKPASGFGNTSIGFGQSAASGFGTSNTGFGQSTSGFGASSTGFGQPSTSSFGNTNSGFGQAATSSFGAANTGFGQTSGGFGNTNTGFGQAKTGFGQTGTTGFGQTSSSGFGQTTNTGFGQTASTGFGQPASTGFGQAANTGFGQTANTGFGQAGAAGFGQPANTGFGQTANSGFGQAKPGFGAGFGQNSNTGFGQSSNLGTGFGLNSNMNPQQGMNLQANNTNVANSLGVSVLLHSLNPDQNAKNIQSIPPPAPSFSVTHPYGYISLLEDLKSDPKFDQKEETKPLETNSNFTVKADVNLSGLIDEDVVFSKLRSTTQYVPRSGFNYFTETSFSKQVDSKIDSKNDPSEIFRSSSINPAFITQPLRYNVPLRYAAIRTAAMSPNHTVTYEKSKEGLGNNDTKKL